MFEKIFGSNTDWISQHSVFPDYFRQLFYRTGDLFPQFALNIGGGQNIYNFSYYGLYNPLLLPSYLLPFIKMSDYLMAVSILCLIADGILMFYWLRRRRIPADLCAGVSLLFLAASPMLFHSYTHVMFVNYMPFLTAGLLGVDRYFEKKKSGLLILSVFLMVMTSFYFSIGGCMVLGIYGVYRYWCVKEQSGELRIRSIPADGIRFCIPFLTGICMSCMLLVPTAMALKNCERQGGSEITLSKLFLPDLKWSQLFYNPYGIGLTTLILTVLFTGIVFKKRQEKYLSCACLVLVIIPAFRFALNGGLYIRGKVLIPMLPLLCFLTALYLKKIRDRDISSVRLILPAAATAALMLAGYRSGEKPLAAVLTADAVLTLLCILFFSRKGCEKLLLYLSVSLLILCGVFENGVYNNMTDRKFYEKVTDSRDKEISQEILNKETGFYRTEERGSLKEEAADINRVLSEKQYLSSVYSSTYNVEYQNFREKTFQLEQPYRNIFMEAVPENPIFQKLMGIKYIISDREVPGYEKISDRVYRNQDVFPMIYGTDSLLPETDYENLQFPYNQLAFLKYAVTESAQAPLNWETELESGAEELNIGWEQKTLHLNHPVSEEITVPEAEEGDIFFLQFDVSNKHRGKDVSIYLEGVRNKLSARNHIYYNGNETFTYAVPLKEGQTELELQFGSGTYSIQNVRSFLYRNTLNQEYTEFKVNQDLTGGNRITGTIDGKNDEYLITSIPYDKNFEIRVDGRKAETERVNTAFLGTKIKKGKHTVEIIYHAEGFRSGLFLSALGWALFLFIMISGRKRQIPSDHVQNSLHISSV